MPSYQNRPAAYSLKLSEVKKIVFATTTFRDRCIIKGLFWAGLRRAEVVTLDIRDIDFRRKRLTVNGKGDKTRTVPIIDDELLNDLRHLVGANKKGPVFLGPADKALSPRMINKITSSVLQDGQFDECPLTFKEIRQCNEVFVQVLVGVYHQRIEYADTADISGQNSPKSEDEPEKNVGVITLDLDKKDEKPPWSERDVAIPEGLELDMNESNSDWESLRHLPRERKH